MKLRKILILVLAALMLVTATPIFDPDASAEYNMPYYIEIDLTNQIVTIFSTASGVIVRQMLCSTGTAKAETPVGTFYLPKKKERGEREEWYYFRMYNCWAHYATRLWKGVLFHSIPCNRKSDASISKKAVEEFGHPASHGCIRLLWQDAEFIAKCCLAGTRVRIYRSKKRDEELRDMLYVASYTNEKGQSYKAYLGIPEEEGVLGRYSKGNEVRSLQTRLRDLGIFPEAIDGEYGATTVNAVRQAQKLMGEEPTGVATLEFQAAIYADDAPTAQNVTIQEGMSGPVVRNLQQNLQTLKLYEGVIDGVFDVDVRQAVEKFQAAYGYSVDGVLLPEIQKAIYYEAGKVQALFLKDGGYECEYTTGQLYMGRVAINVGIRLREKMSSNSKALARLASGDIVVALEHGTTWSKVQREENVGYVKNEFMEYYQQDVYAIRYTSTDGQRTYTIGHTPKEYYEGAKIPAEEFESYLAANGSLDSYEGIVNYVRVVTEGDGVVLNLREAPNTVSAILAELPNGTEAKVLLRSSEWTLVEWEDKRGYLMNQYLEFWGEAEEQPTGEEPEEEAGIEADNSALLAEVSAAGGKAPVYDVDSSDAAVLGHLKNGIRVEVLRTEDGWSYISYQGHTGFMKDDDLLFLLSEEVVT